MNHQMLRGRKLKCQNEACGLSFYDLNRPSAACPSCGTAFQHIEIEKAPPRSSARRFQKRYTADPAPAAAANEDAPGLEAELDPLDASTEADLSTLPDADGILEPDDGEDDAIVSPVDIPKKDD